MSANDGIKAQTSKVQVSDGFSTSDVENVVVSGSAGSNPFDTGANNVEIRGGADFDTAVLDFLDDSFPDDIDIFLAETPDGLEITGNVDNTSFGAVSQPWKQRFSQVEAFEVDGVTYTAAEIISAFG